MPFVAEKIWENIGKDSVHLQEWPKFEKKKINEKLNENIKLVREIISIGLRQRDQNKIGLKWPLSEIKISYSKKLDKEFLEMIKRELNVKKINFNLAKDETPKVELNFEMTEELEAEGYAREISRQIQAFRKKLGLEKKDLIELKISTDEELKKILESQKNFIKERTNSKRFEIVTTDKERFKNNIDFKIKDKRGLILIK